MTRLNESNIKLMTEGKMVELSYMKLYLFHSCSIILW